MQNLTQQMAKDNLEQIINKEIYELDPDFWEKIRPLYLEEVKSIESTCEDLLRKGFHAEEAEIREFMRTLDQMLHTHTVEYVRRLFRDINTNLLRKFNKYFKKDESGKNREWREIEEGRIRDLWSKYRAQMLEMINSEFKYIKLPRAALQEALDESCKNHFI